MNCTENKIKNWEQLAYDNCPLCNCKLRILKNCYVNCFSSKCGFIITYKKYRKIQDNILQKHIEANNKQNFK
jgi:hypothetical protein